MLLDEPESFLHPPLARQLGEIIGEAESDERQIFIATHSVELLKGILSKGQDINIIRITRPKDNSNQISIVDNDDLKNIVGTRYEQKKYDGQILEFEAKDILNKGIAVGMEQGLVDMITKKLVKSKPISQIADELELSEERILELIEKYNLGK